MRVTDVIKLVQISEKLYRISRCLHFSIIKRLRLLDSIIIWSADYYVIITLPIFILDGEKQIREETAVGSHGIKVFVK